MPTFGVLDIILLLGISQGIFLAITLHFMDQKNAKSNQVLSIFLVFAVVMLIGRLFFIRYGANPWLFRIGACVDTTVFLFGPMLYLYVRRLCFNEDPNFNLSLRNYVPAILHFCFVLFTFSYSIRSYQELSLAGAFSLPYFLIEVAGLTVNGLFLYRCFNLLSTFKRSESNHLSFKQSVSSFLSVLLTSIVIILGIWLLSIGNQYIFGRYSMFFNYDIIWILLSCVVYIVGFYSLKQPELFRLPMSESKEKMPLSSNEGERLNKEEAILYSETLEQLMVVDKIYLDNKLTLKKLADQLGTSTNNVSWLLNNSYQSNFYEFVNSYRISEFIDRLEKGEHHRYTLSTISMDVGFNSKSTFNKAFKSFTSQTPSEYIKLISTGKG